jgi:exopolysaccharide/PEP-CTERM locus tyrosine autokinase
VGKIFDALEKFSKERGDPSSSRLKDSDYEALMRFDDTTGRIEICDLSVARDRKIFKRLKTFRLINEDGTLTPAGRAKYDELTHRSKLEYADDKDQTPESRVSRQQKKVSGPFANIPEANWDLLLNYNRQTGNILTYDPETGQLDKKSRDILKDPDLVQRLIDNKLILPGGWLTTEAKIECNRIDANLRDDDLSLPAEENKTVSSAISEDIDTPPDDLLSQAGMEVLQDYNEETLKLNLDNSLIVKNPEILKRFQENGLIDKEGTLSAKALVWCRVLFYWNKEFKKKAILTQPVRDSTGKKIKAAKDNDTPQKTSIENADEKKLKIIPLKEKEKAPVEDDKFIPPPEARTKKTKPAEAQSKTKFSLGEARTTHIHFKREARKDLVTLREPHSFEAEQFKILRTNLLFAESGITPRSLLVTSAMPGEGKSFVAINLAVSIARHVNWNVLLIDCDLRRPNIHRRFGYADVPGLSDYLSNGTDLQSLLLKTDIEKLTILPAGKLPDNPSELLSSERMAVLLKEVTARYQDRLVILDSPPPKLTAESGALARYVDGILLVVKYNGTPKDIVTEMINKLGRNKIIGAVINNFDAGRGRYRKKYYGGEYFRK